ncbi:MAG: hypothetical protein GY938_19140 [Ketobacter sp.]|nr:hypothetical protein [Ketobacter sp.]
MLETIKLQTVEVFNTVVALLPTFAGALALLLLGWILARFLKLLTIRLTGSFNNLLARRFYGSTLEFARLSPSLQRILSSVVFWATNIVFVAVAVRVAGFTGAAVWLERVVVYLPSLIGGGLIIVGGVVVGGVTRKFINHAALAAEIDNAELLARFSQFTFVIVGLVIGLGQIGVDVTLLILLFGIVLAAILTGFSLAFGLGAKSMVENLIANQHMKLMIKPGQQIVCGSVQGRVLEFTPTCVVLETIEGRTLIPAKLCMDQTLDIIITEVKDEHNKSIQP